MTTKFEYRDRVNTPRGAGTVDDVLGDERYLVRIDVEDELHAFDEAELYCPLEEKRKEEDIVRRLRSWAGVPGVPRLILMDIAEAADEIERLRDT